MDDLDFKHIHAHKPNTQNYIVTVAYLHKDSHEDKFGWDNGEVWKVDIHAVDNITAIQNALKIIAIERANKMTDYVSMLDDEVINTKEDVIDIQRRLIETNLFTEWQLIEPTSIQCHLANDENMLFDITVNNIDNHISTTADQVEKYLKGFEDGNSTEST